MTGWELLAATVALYVLLWLGVTDGLREPSDEIRPGLTAEERQRMRRLIGL